MFGKRCKVLGSRVRDLARQLVELRTENADQANEVRDLGEEGEGCLF